MSIHHINNVCKYFTIWNLLFEVMEWKNGAIYTTFSPLYSKKINGNDGKVTQGVSWSLLIYIYIYIYITFYHFWYTYCQVTRYLCLKRN